MTGPSPTIQVNEVRFHVLPMRTRFPFQYGIASMTALPHLFVTVELEVDGRPVTGLSSEGLPPKWFTKNPETRFEEDLPDMLAVIRNAARLAMEAGKQDSYFACWEYLYQRQASWAGEQGYPPLLSNLGVSLMERAVLDGLCRKLKLPLCEVVQKNLLSMDLDRIYPELDGYDPADLLPSAPQREIIVRHTVGLGDPLRDDDIDRPLNDGLPHSLEASVKAYGLDHFKIKLCGNLERDRARLIELKPVLESTVRGRYLFTLDGNEQYHDLATFREHWARLHEVPEISALFEQLLFVEQPLHRDCALDETVKQALSDWRDAPPLIIDESDAETGCLPTALELGYSGTSHKNCKGIVKGIANACLLAFRKTKQPERRYILSGEDLANVGPVALLQDLAIMSLLGIRHVERNGHHYFRGLGMLPEDLQATVLSSHGDLYRKHEQGFPTLRITDGKLAVDSVLRAPFGFMNEINPSQFVSLDEWDGEL